MLWLLIFVVLYGQVRGSSLGSATTTPEQVHIALGDNPHDLVVSWLTFIPTTKAVVQLTLPNQTLVDYEGHVTPFTNIESFTTRYISKVVITDLEPRTEYVYQVGDGKVWSKKHYKFTGPDPEGLNPRFIVFGDLGVENGQCIPALNYEITTSPPDVVLHIGDIGYELYQSDGHLGDTFINLMEPAASLVPYMVAVGNHEYYNNFSDYKVRFAMPGGHDNHYYSINYGPIHFVTISTESLFYFEDDPHFHENQMRWLRDDLEVANKERDKRPWVVVLMHRHMYCSAYVCSKHIDEEVKGPTEDQVVRDAFEDLLYAAGVDIIFVGHWHVYERTWPVYNYQVFNGSLDEPYLNAQAPIQVVTGAPGMFDGTNCFSERSPSWSAAHSSAYGYTRLNVLDKMTLGLEQVALTRLPDNTVEVVDSFVVSKTNSRNFPAEARHPQHS